jgi:hypothetical protein
VKHWTAKRRASFAIHTTIVTVPFLFSTVSAWLFWYALFQDGVIASAMIFVIDALALTGMILYITRISSPFQILRHALPFVSMVPLGIELYSVLLPNGHALAVTVALLSTAIMVTVAALCFRTIEQLFIPPIDAAREKAAQDVAALALTMEQLKVVMEAVAVFRESSATPQLIVGETLESPATITPLSKTEQVRRLAAARGISISTAWRRVQSGEEKLED